ncbi:MAG: cell division protein FtsB [Gammaproteobacteria bacterium]
MRLLIVLLSVILLLLQYRLWGSEDGFRSVWSLKRAIEGQQDENERLTERNDHLEAEVRDLKEGLDAVEEIARTDLGMIGEDETFFQIAAPEQQDDDSQ